MKKMLLKTVLAGVLVFLFTVGVNAQSTPWACFFAGTCIYNGQPAPVGTIIKAYDPDGVNCGNWIVHTSGLFGAMAVVGDDTTDPDDPTDEGAVSGDIITFYINGLKADCVGDCTWTDKTTKEIELSVSEDSVTIALQIVMAPGSRQVLPGELISVKVGVRNLGNGTDMYKVSAYTDSGLTYPQDTASHADPDDTTFVYFNVKVPIWNSDTVHYVYYKVFSAIDTTVYEEGNFRLYRTITDVDDNPIVGLPGSFELYQNYPNPFNPTTTISFNLTSRSTVKMEIYDITGRLVEERELGSLPAGSHDVEFNASSFASGVYFYRLATETTSQTRKMVLIK